LPLQRFEQRRQIAAAVEGGDAEADDGAVHAGDCVQAAAAGMARSAP
jgi:hypothetical protein